MTDDASWLKGLLARKSVTPARPDPSPPSPPLRRASIPSPEDLVAPAVWQPGDLISDIYKIECVLGEGGMGTVHKVLHRSWRIDLAVKSPKKEVLERAGTDGFVRECQTWVNLGLHPHVVSCHYVRVLGGIPRVFAEYVDGGSLSDWIRSGQLYEGGHSTALRRIVDVAIQFAWGLDYAHEHQLIHRDVKPANVMMTRSGIAKITDFGLAHAAASALPTAEPGEVGQTILISSGGMTPAYCSPEQYAGRLLTRATDVWSFGLSVLEMFAGEVTWTLGCLAPGLLTSHLGSPPDDTRLPQMPAGVAALLQRCFATDPSDRPGSMSEIAAQLLQIYRELCGQPYPRKSPRLVTLRASALNNRALSHIDLGRADLAVKSWNEALLEDPLHLESTYNFGLWRWRLGELTDDNLLTQLHAASQAQGDGHLPGLSQLLTAHVFMERGDLRRAAEELREAPTPPPLEVLKLQSQIDAYADPAGGLDIDAALQDCLHTLDRGRGWVRSLNGGLLTLSSPRGAPATVVVRDEWVTPPKQWSRRVPRVGPARDPLAIDMPPRGSSLCVSADGSTALLFPQRDQIVVLDARKGEFWGCLEGVDMNVLNAALSIDGRTAVAILGTRGASKICQWDVHQGVLVRTFERQSGGTQLYQALCVAVCSLNHVVLTGDTNGTIRIWDLTNGRYLRSMDGHTGMVHALTISTGRQRALSVAEDRTARYWNLQTGRCLRTIDLIPGLERDALAASIASSVPTDIETARDAGPISVAAPFRVAPVLGIELHQSRDTRARELLAKAEQLLQQGQIAEALRQARELRGLRGWERATEALNLWYRLSRSTRKTRVRGAWPIRMPGSESMRLTSVCMSADGSAALAGDANGHVRLLDLANRSQKTSHDAHQGPVDAVAMSRDRRVGVSCSFESIRLWDLSTLREMRRLETQPRATRHDGSPAIHLSGDGRLLLVGRLDKIQVWDAAAGTLLNTIEAPGVDVLQTFDDAERLVAASATGRITLCKLRHVVMSRQDIDSAAITEDKKAEADLWFERRLGHYRSSLTVASDEMSILHSRPCDIPRLVDVRTRSVQRPIGKGIHFITVASGDLRWWLSQCCMEPQEGVTGFDRRTLQLWDTATGEPIHTFDASSLRAKALALSEDAATAVTCMDGNPPQFWHLDWDLEPHETDTLNRPLELIRPHLERFLDACKRGIYPIEVWRSDKAGLIIGSEHRRQRGPSQWHWSDAQLDELVAGLGRLGFGFVSKDTVRQELERLRGDESA